MHQILNSKGEPIVLSPLAMEYANNVQENYNGLGKEKLNALGGEINFTTLTAVQSKILQQKFFTIAPGDYVPVVVGNGAWAEQLLTLREYALAGDFENGVINTASNLSRLAEDTAGVDSVLVNTVKWAKQINWSLPELAVANRSGNWNIVEAKERSRKRDWDLGIQKVAFLGMPSQPGIYGLLTQPNVTSNTTLITQSISTMTPDQFSAFVGGLITAYQVNAAYTVMPDTFLIPQADFNVLTIPSSSSNPFKTRLAILQEALAGATQNPNFKIVGVPYADKAVNASGLNLNRYVLYRRDQDSVRMEIPVDYTATLAGTINNFQFQNVAYGNFTGVFAYRPLEMLYFDRA